MSSDAPAEAGNILARATGWDTLRASGPDARAWLNGLLTADIEAVTDERGVWSLLLNKRGKIVCDLTLVAAPDGLWLGTPGDASQLVTLLNDYLVMEDVECELSQGFRWITLHGIGASELAAKERSAVEAVAQVAWADTQSVALLVMEERAQEFLSRLGRRYAVELFDAQGWARWRVINGVPAFGIDFGPDDNPHQASLERRTVSWTKGCYLGQEVVCMQDMRGKTKRRLVRLYSRDASLWQEGMRVLDAEGAELGQITTANPSANEEIACAIARVKAPNFEPGSKVYVAEQSATVGSLMSAPRGL